MGQYLPILMLGVLAGVFAVVSIVASHLMAPKKPNPVKQAPYECGVDPLVDPPDQFPVKFFLVAMIFIVFDVEIIFLYPWAVSHSVLGLFGLGAVLIFSFAVFESFVYLISNGVLNWGPSKIGLAIKKAKARDEHPTIMRIPNSSKALTSDAFLEEKSLEEKSLLETSANSS